MVLVAATALLVLAGPAHAAQSGSGSTTYGPYWASGRVGDASISLTCSDGSPNLRVNWHVDAPAGFPWGADQGSWATYTTWLLYWDGDSWEYLRNTATGSNVLRRVDDTMARGFDFAAFNVPRNTYVRVLTKVDWKVLYIHQDPSNYWGVTIDRTDILIGSGYYYSSYCRTF